MSPTSTVAATEVGAARAATVPGAAADVRLPGVVRRARPVSGRRARLDTPLVTPPAGPVPATRPKE